MSTVQNNVELLVEVWVEDNWKLATLIGRKTGVRVIPFPKRPSAHFLETLAGAVSIPRRISYLNDYDPDENVAADVEAKLRELAPNVIVEFAHVGLTSEQITEIERITERKLRPSEDGPVELGAIPPEVLLKIVRDLIDGTVAASRRRGSAAPDPSSFALQSCSR
jgi:hypothetical protein